MTKLLCQKKTANHLDSLLTCRSISTGKQPDGRPMGFRQVLKGIIRKIIMELLRRDGSLQLCAGQDAGSEAAIHVVYKMFKEEDTEAVLMVDASNAFNSINRETFLHISKLMYPSLLTY